MNRAAQAAEAAKSGDESRLIALLDAGVSPDTADDDGFPLLHLAAWHGHERVVSLLLKRKADINQKDGYDFCPIHLAALYGRPDVVSELLTRSADILAVGPYGRNVLMFAASCESDNSAVVHALARASTLHVNATSEHYDKTTALILACQHSTAGTVTALLDVGADVRQRRGDEITEIHHATREGKTDAVARLIRQGVDVNAKNYNGDAPIHVATLHSKAEVVDLLLNHIMTDVNIRNDQDNTALLIAAALTDPSSADQTNRSIMTSLLSHGADPNVCDPDGMSPLHHTIKAGDVQSSRMLIKAGADVNQQDVTETTPLLLASQKSLDLVKLIMNTEGVDHTLCDDIGTSPIHNALAKGKIEILKYLVSKEIPPEVANIHGETPLYRAMATLNSAAFSTLKEFGCKMNVKDNMARGLLHAVVTSKYHKKRYDIISANPPTDVTPITTKIDLDLKRSQNKISIVTFDHQYQFMKWVSPKDDSRIPFYSSLADAVLDAGLDIDDRDNNEQTPLHVAAAAGFYLAVVYLVEHNANLLARDKFGHLPVTAAVEHYNTFLLLWIKTKDSLSDDDLTELAKMAHWHDAKNVYRKLIPLLKVQPKLDHLPKKIKPQFIKWKLDYKFERYMPIWMTTLESFTYVKDPKITDDVFKLIKKIEAGIRTLNPLLAVVFSRCGSEEEGTKVIAMDEQDTGGMSEKLEMSMFTMSEHDTKLIPFVEFIVKEDYHERLKSILDSKKRLSQTKVCRAFNGAVRQVTADPELWREFPNIQRLDTKDVTEQKRRIAALNIRWHDDIYMAVDISIDMVAMVDLGDWWPSWASQHPKLKDNVHLIGLPKWKHTNVVDLPLMEIGVYQWGPLFSKMPEQMKQGYRLAKTIRDKGVCPQIKDWQTANKFMDTYFLKQTIIREFLNFFDANTGEQIKDFNNEDDVFWAKRIYEKMEEAFHDQILYSVLFPQYNLLHEPHFAQYKDRACQYARLCRQLLTRESASKLKRAHMGIDEETQTGLKRSYSEAFESSSR